MNIVSTIKSHVDARKTLNTVGLNFIYSEDNLYNICELDINVLISQKDCSAVSKEYPAITFIYPNAQFPNYSLNNFQAFNSIELIEECPTLDKTNECCFINTSNVNKLFVKKLESMYSLDCYGIGHGHSEIKMPIMNSVQVYRNYDICAATLLPEVYKILALRKKCITQLDHPYCNNVFGRDQTGDGYNFSMNKTYFDLFATIFKESHPDLSEDLTNKKKDLHGTN